MTAGKEFQGYFSQFQATFGVNLAQSNHQICHHCSEPVVESSQDRRKTSSCLIIYVSQILYCIPVFDKINEAFTPAFHLIISVISRMLIASDQQQKYARLGRQGGLGLLVPVNDYLSGNQRQLNLITRFSVNRGALRT